MKIAIPVEDGKLAGHFGHSPFFAFIDTDDETGAIVARSDEAAPPHEPGVLPTWLAEHGVDMVITGGVGPGAQNLLTKKGIGIVVGVTADTPEALVAAHYAGTLASGVNGCSHDGEDGHGHHHHHHDHH